MKLFEGCKRCMLIGFIFGVLGVPILMYGGNIPIIGFVFHQVLLIPKLISLLLFGTSPILLMLVSGLFWGLVGFLISKILDSRCEITGSGIVCVPKKTKGAVKRKGTKK